MGSLFATVVSMVYVFCAFLVSAGTWISEKDSGYTKPTPQTLWRRFGGSVWVGLLWPITTTMNYWLVIQRWIAGDPKQDS